MLIVRPATHHDTAAIEKLVTSHAAKVTTLPKQIDKLGERIELSCQAFQAGGEAALTGEESEAKRFLFVLEDSETGEVLGSAGVDAIAGNGSPFYNYRQDELIHASHQLGVHNRVPVLYLTHELTGKTLLCSFTLAESARSSENYKLLSRARLLFIDLFNHLFADELIVEIQGVQGEDGESPFWNSLGRHFFNMDFATADYYSAVKSKTFIAELMPPHPIYVPLLTPEAQAAIGHPHEATEASCQLLYREGFRVGKHVDIFDGGPVLSAWRSHITTINSAQRKRVRSGNVSAGARYLVCNTHFSDFRCGIAQMTDGLGDVIRVQPKVAELLQLTDNEAMVFAPL
ncbi:MAG: arginine N-succinyltransferase [Hahellaceae bacterium]|nr:arginine N-succinyltransferase [Hahellaceae bacterium]MCP5168791.1 arginine N-succinyltransferase [Hahellaceae bacterium]